MDKRQAKRLHSGDEIIIKRGPGQVPTLARVLTVEETTGGDVLISAVTISGDHYLRDIRHVEVR